MVTYALVNPSLRVLDCGCSDRKHWGRWNVLVLCAQHFLGRVPEQDTDGRR